MYRGFFRKKIPKEVDFLKPDYPFKRQQRKISSLIVVIAVLSVYNVLNNVVDCRSMAPTAGTDGINFFYLETTSFLPEAGHLTPREMNGSDDVKNLHARCPRR